MQIGSGSSLREIFLLQHDKYLQDFREEALLPHVCNFTKGFFRVYDVLQKRTSSQLRQQINSVLLRQSDILRFQIGQLLTALAQPSGPSNTSGKIWENASSKLGIPEPTESLREQLSYSWSCKLQDLVLQDLDNYKVNHLTSTFCQCC